MLFVSDLPPLCVPGAIRHELIRTLKGTSPLYIKPRPDLSLLVWLLRFATHCNRIHRDHAMRARDSLLRASREFFDALVAEERLECDFDHRGVLIAFIDPVSLDGYASINRLLEPFGLGARRLDRQAVRRLEPALGDDVCGGWHHPADSHLRPEWLMRSWSQAAKKRGVAIEENCSVTHIDTQKGRVQAVGTSRGRFTADHIILAAGAWTTAMALSLGIRLPIQPGKGYSITMARPASYPGLPLYLYERNMVVTPWKSGYRLGGTMEFSGFDTTLNARRLDNLERSAALYLKTPVGRPVVERWTGLRPMCADDLPIIDRVPHLKNLYIATGHGMLGISTAPATGRLMADMVAGRKPLVDPAPFSIQRFSGLR
ncbi:NAD(P)/FAD-dependent oxidoreductase [Desulfosarcina cetonica]|uniref:NAD(P)/FAD-dependent oxidoreductase n=1 Tax=Desulfosarcina cetonica TaxID=90730 RepID=UPI0006D17970|nr:FAD-dependent oxidoreductase [Desulfosarcina cetonica]